MHAFVIDDSKTVRSILVKMLRGLGFETTEAENGQQALDCLSGQKTLDLFLVNWNMPVLDGLQFIKRIKSDVNLASIPLVVVSAESGTETIATATAAGASGYLVKPVTSSALRDSLRSIGVELPAAEPLETPEAVDAPKAVDAAARFAGSTAIPTPNRTTSRQAVRHSSKPERAVAASSRKTRVLVVDDSVVVRGIVTKLLQEDAEIEVVSTAADGAIALQKLKQHEVDVILLDIEMPRMNGFEVLKTLRDEGSRIPVVMFSSLTERGGAATIEALMLGAKDYVMKPGGAYMTDAAEGRRTILEELVPKIKQFADRPVNLVASEAARMITSVAPFRRSHTRIDAVVIGVSTGGPQALAKVIPKLGQDFPVPVFIVQHMPEDFTRHLADRLTTDCGFPVTEAVHGQKAAAGQFLIAPGGYHLAVKRCQANVMVTLNQEAAVNSCRPSADVLFQSAARAYQANVLGVVMTGMGSDGAMGTQSISQAGGQVVVQDEDSCVVWGMPGSVVRNGSADQIVPLEQLASEILSRVWRARSRKTGMEDSNGGSN
jgi:two-component system, chemotaxis family, protein-glutamate methylesterase/glutaminase